MEIYARTASPAFAGSTDAANAIGTAASLSCGSFVRFGLSIDEPGLVVSDIKYQTNGCGFTVAAAEIIGGSLLRRRLTELHGLQIGELFVDSETAIGEFPSVRRQCAEICFQAVQAALANFRASRVAEFTGEKALICSCFGVDEETIERAIDENSLVAVGGVTERTNAGAGCGSCRMMIEEILDSRGS
jgi:NifU-like protein